MPAGMGPPDSDDVMPPVPWSGARTMLGLGALLVVTIISAIVVAAFDPDIESLGARLALQVLLAAALIGVAFAIATRPATGSPRRLLGLRRPLRSRSSPP